MKILRAAAALLLLATPLASHAWWNEDWKFRKELTFDLSPAGADITATPSEVAVLVRLHIGNFTYFADTKPDGADLRFLAADDKTPLKFHIERYDPQNQMALIWVRVPRLTGGGNADKIFLYYGNPAATAASDPAGSYDKDQALVLHFSEAAGAAPQDATANKNHATAPAGELYPAALIGGGLRLNGSATMHVAASPSLKVQAQQGATVSAWVRFEAPPQNAVVAALEDAGRGLVLGVNGAQAFARLAGGKGNVDVSGGQLTPGTWHHLAVRAGAGRLTLFVDGAEAGAANADLPEIAGALTVGGSARGSGGSFAGEIDELQVSTAARSAEWLKVAARSQGMNAKLVAYGGDTQKDSGDVSYFAITLRNVTVDGWVVIGILFVMFVGSLLVMLGKGLYLGSVRRTNSKFLLEFQQHGHNLPAEEDRFGASTLYPLYSHGLREMNKRLQGQAAGADRAQILSAQSIEAIRATMDATLTRLIQRLSSQMVLLTICISGGPFLGLLGTVIGVMITFAAIAASGDVNINAIAPGTAAALAATVAGLAVAIPCLFGYNFLNTRIKEITADMRVFVDEFVTQAAENYS